MTDYTPKYVTTNDIRSFTSPTLDFDDVSEAELLIKIEVVESYITDVYELTSASEARIPTILLVASKLVTNPSIAKKFYTLSEETIGRYHYKIASPASAGIMSPNQLSTTWESMALEILRMKSSRKNYKWRIYISDLLD